MATTKMSVGENIRQKRIEAGLSQTELASLLAVSEKTVSRWELDGNIPKGSTVIKLAKALGCSVDEVILERKERGIAPEMRAVFMRFSELPDELKPMARSAISAVLATFEEEAARKGAA